MAFLKLATIFALFSIVYCDLSVRPRSITIYCEPRFGECGKITTMAAFLHPGRPLFPLWDVHAAKINQLERGLPCQEPYLSRICQKNGCTFELIIKYKNYEKSWVTNDYHAFGTHVLRVPETVTDSQSYEMFQIFIRVTGTSGRGPETVLDTVARYRPVPSEERQTDVEDARHIWTFWAEEQQKEECVYSYLRLKMEVDAE